MKVTPAKKKFGIYAPGDVFELKDKPAKMLIKVGILRAAEDVPVVEAAAPGYKTRMMLAEMPPLPVHTDGIRKPEDLAPYGYKADGTPRQRPGRPAKSE